MICDAVPREYYIHYTQISNGMSLYEAADGLLDTHVTWQDVESELQKVLATDAEFGEKRAVFDIGQMKGFLSKIAMIQADWTYSPKCMDSGESHLKSKKLPDRIVVKISSELSLFDFSTLVSSSQWTIEKMQSMTEMVKDCHNREVGMYRILMREQPKCPIVNVLALESFTDKNPLKAYIISEYIPDLQHIGMHQVIPVRDLESVVDGIAAFSAMGESMSEQERSATMGEVYIEEAIKYFYSEHSPDDMRKNFVEVLGVAYEDKIEEAMDIFDFICNSPSIQKNYSRVSQFLGHRPVLMHSDIWPSNMLFSRSPDDDHLEFQALIDFQTASFSSPGLDVGCLMVTCLSKTDRRTRRTEILDRYFDAFLRNLKPGKSCPYTREQLDDSFDLCFPAAVILMLPFILSFSIRLGDNILDESIDKMAGLIEDLVSIHESNQKKFPEFFQPMP